MEHIILVNPVAGTKNNIKYGIRIQKLLSKNNINSRIYVSKYAGHITEIVKELSSKNTCKFYSVGGDGTLNEIVSGIIGTDSEIVVMASGTGNDFVKSCSKFKSLRKIVCNSLYSTSEYCDVIKISKDKYCINILSVGFDSMVGKNVDKFRWVPFISGTGKYNLSIIYTLFQNKNFKFKIRVNNKIYKGNYTLVAISNGKYYGGGVCPNPKAEPNDNILDACIIDQTSIKDKILLLPKYKKGLHKDLYQAHFEQCTEITIVSNKEFPINVDGEIFYSKKLKCTLLPKAVKINFIK